MHQAKSGLSDLVARAEAGEEIVIARRNKPAVKLVPVDSAPKKPRVPGALAHLRGKLPDDLFLTPLSEDEFEARGDKYSKLIARVEAGEEVVLARGDKPVAKIVPLEPAKPKTRGAGAWKGRFTVPDSFFEPLPEEELRAWEGDYEPPS